MKIVWWPLIRRIKRLSKYQAIFFKLASLLTISCCWLLVRPALNLGLAEKINAFFLHIGNLSTQVYVTIKRAS